MAMCMFKYLFEISLSIPEDVGFYVHYKNNRSLVKVKSIDGANISSFTGEDVSWLTKNGNKQNDNQHHKILKISTNNKKVPLRYIHTLNENEIFSGGVVQPTKFSIYEVIFKIPNKRFIEDENNIKELENFASESIRLFTDKYRLVTQETDVYLPKPSDSPIIEIWYTDTVEQDGEFLTANIQPYKRIVNFNGLKDQNKSMLSDEKMKILDDALKSEKDLPLYQQLLLEAKEQGQLRNHYDLSIIKTNTSFEVFLQELLIDCCQRLGIKELPVGKGNNIKKLPSKNYKEAIEEGKIIDDLLKKYLKIVIGNNCVLAVKEYNHWHSKAYTLRNEIIHSGRSNIAEAEAKQAFETTNNLIALISKKVNEKFNEMRSK